MLNPSLEITNVWTLWLIVHINNNKYHIQTLPNPANTTQQQKRATCPVTFYAITHFTISL